MGWYDTFKGDTNKASSNLIKANSTNAMKELGKGLSDFGDAWQEHEINNKKKKLIDSQLKTKTLNQTAKQQDIDDAFAATTTKAIDDAFLSNLDENGKFVAKDDIGIPLNQVSFNAKQEAKKIQKQKEAYYDKLDDKAQKEINQEALKKSFSYKDLETFKAQNEDLFKYTEGKTINAIKKQFNNTNEQINNLKTQKTINSLQTKIDKAKLKTLKASKDNKDFKYTQDTGTKIANLISKSMGMDAPDYSIDDSMKKEFNTVVTEVSTISKEYKLEPNLAYKLYLSNINKTTQESKKQKINWKHIKID